MVIHNLQQTFSACNFFFHFTFHVSLRNVTEVLDPHSSQGSCSRHIQRWPIGLAFLYRHQESVCQCRRHYTVTVLAKCARLLGCATDRCQKRRGCAQITDNLQKASDVSFSAVRLCVIYSSCGVLAPFVVLDVGWQVAASSRVSGSTIHWQHLQVGKHHLPVLNLRAIH